MARRPAKGKGKKAGGGCASRSSLTFPQALQAAYLGGRRYGDTGAFVKWLCEQGLHTRGGLVVQKLRQEFEAGVLSLAGKVEKKAKEAGVSAGMYKGVQITKQGDEFFTALEPESAFESARDAKRFIDQYRNPVNPHDRYDWESMLRAGTLLTIMDESGYEVMKRFIKVYGADKANEALEIGRVVADLNGSGPKMRARDLAEAAQYVAYGGWGNLETLAQAEYARDKHGRPTMESAMKDRAMAILAARKSNPAGKRGTRRRNMDPVLAGAIGAGLFGPAMDFVTKPVQQYVTKHVYGKKGLR